MLLTTKGRMREGDTIVEMIFAFTILSLVIVGVLMIMNKGIRMSQESIEATLVRQQMDGQAEMIRFLHDTNDPLWNTIKTTKLSSDILPINSSTCAPVGTLASSAKSAFYVMKRPAAPFSLVSVNSSSYADPTAYARVDYAAGKSYGIWLQVAKAENGASPITAPQRAAVVAYDVYVHGCWYGAEGSAPRTLGTIVRLYDQQ